MNVFGRMVKMTVALSALMVSLMNGTVYAANITELIASGDAVYYQQPESYRSAANSYFERVPNSVIMLFKQNGGSIHYTDSVLVGQQDVNGIYTFDSKQISLKTTSNNNSWDEVQKAPVHEMGHFIYHTTQPMFTDQMKADINKLYNERKSFDKRCYNEDETFAALYSDYIKFDYRSGARPMPSPEYRVFAQAEMLCEQMLTYAV
ncbi:hypothetical protein BXO88_09610 [Oribacterium sp. C9]|uniref:hypothetical protein n=1 Tax=Oribacterium sp. C9 TaxID=1943579 RepID=UPI00098F5D91|nr:hypothetical protein [Oribacterium sp. C9]OON86079.1 hypothetical protein BXO88_09610 [Oribacterium sp. C9]